MASTLLKSSFVISDAPRSSIIGFLAGSLVKERMNFFPSLPLNLSVNLL